MPNRSRPAARGSPRREGPSFLQGALVAERRPGARQALTEAPGYYAAGLVVGWGLVR